MRDNRLKHALTGLILAFVLCQGAPTRQNLAPTPERETSSPDRAAEQVRAPRAPKRAWGDAAWRADPVPPGKVRVFCDVPSPLAAATVQIRAHHTGVQTSSVDDGWSSTIQIIRADPSASPTPRSGPKPSGSRARGHIVVRAAGRIGIDFPVPDAHADIEGSLTDPGVGTGTLVVSLEPTGGTCQVRDAVGFAFINGRVVGATAAGTGTTKVYGCGGMTTLDSSDSFFMEVAPVNCELTAVRTDGAFTVRSSPVRVDPKSGGEVVIDLSLPPFRSAGVGTAIEQVHGGIHLITVFPDTPAARAGLRDHDLVVELDGADVSGLDADSFIAMALGPEGTDVTYTVEREGELVDLTMTREVMDARPSR